ncbi:MAG TPA: hypothetical protein PKM88_10470 [bacterium]|nr:hypothetical protein [bacterium]
MQLKVALPVMNNARWLFAIFFAALLLLSDCSYVISDEWHYFLLTEALVTRASITLPAAQYHALSAPPVAETIFLPTRFPIGYPLAAVPVYCLLRAGAAIAGSSDYSVVAGCIEIANAAFTALLLVLLAQLLAQRFGQPRRSALIAAAAGCGTILLHYARSNFSESLQALLLFAAVMLLLTRPVLHDRRAALWFGFCLGWLLLTKFIFLLFVPLLYLWAARRWSASGRRRHLLTTALPLLAFLALGGAYNYARTGDWFDFYYPETYTDTVAGTSITVPQNFSDSPWHGLAGYLFSPSKSIFLTSPLLLLALPGLFYWRQQRLDAACLLLLIAGYVLLFACFTGWEGGVCWGPRFLVPLVPLFMLLAAPVFYAPQRILRRLVWLLAAASVLLQLFIAGSNSTAALLAARPHYSIGRFYPLSLNPYPPMVAQYRRMLHPATPPPANIFFLRMADPYRPAFWWWTR